MNSNMTVFGLKNLCVIVLWTKVALNSIGRANLSGLSEDHMFKVKRPSRPLSILVENC